MGCLLFGRSHLPNVTAVERLKPVGDDTTDEHTGGDYSENSPGDGAQCQKT